MEKVVFTRTYVLFCRRTLTDTVGKGVIEVQPSLNLFIVVLLPTYVQPRKYVVLWYDLVGEYTEESHWKSCRPTLVPRGDVDKGRGTPSARGKHRRVTPPWWLVGRTKGLRFNQMVDTWPRRSHVRIQRPEPLPVTETTTKWLRFGGKCRKGNTGLDCSSGSFVRTDHTDTTGRSRVSRPSRLG